MITSDTIRLYDDEDFSEDYPTSRVLEAVAYTFGIDSDRLRAIAEAERDGRVVVLPVAVGTPVYVYFGIPNVSPIDGGIFEYIGEQIEEHEFEMDMLDCWGKNIFATRAEAAAALASAGKGE